MDNEGRDAPSAGSTSRLAAAVFEDFQRTELYWEIKRHVKKDILGSNYSAQEVPAAIRVLMERANLQLQLQNGVYKLYREHLQREGGSSLRRPHVGGGETLDPVASAKIKWNQRVREEIEAVAAEQGRPLQRPKGEGGAEAEGYTMRFLFDEQDFLELLAKINSPNKNLSGEWGRIRLQLRTLSLDQLRDMFGALAPTKRQSGLDDQGPGGAEFGAESVRVAGRVVQMGSLPVAAHFLRGGAPVSERPRLWEVVLGTQLGAVDQYAALRECVDRFDYVTDDLVRITLTLTLWD